MQWGLEAGGCLPPVDGWRLTTDYWCKRAYRAASDVAISLALNSDSCSECAYRAAEVASGHCLSRRKCKVMIWLITRPGLSHSRAYPKDLACSFGLMTFVRGAKKPTTT
jgi:hypothetical protein